MTTISKITESRATPATTSSQSSSSSSSAPCDFPEITAIRPPVPPIRGRGVSAKQWRDTISKYRADKLAFEQSVARSRIAAKAGAEKPREVPKTPKPVIAKAPNRSDLIRQGLLDPASAAVHSSKKARARQTAEAFRAWAKVGESSKKAGVLVKSLSKMALATNPTRARLTGDAAKAVALAKRKYRAERKKTNDANREAKTVAKEEARQAILDVAEATRPERTHTRFPAPGAPPKPATSWTVDDDVPTDDQASWAARHGFTTQRTPTTQLHCNLTGFHFWAASREDVTDQGLNLDPAKWSMERGVFTYHGRLPGSAPITRKPPTHTSGSITLSEQMVSYVNFCKQTASAQALLTDSHIAWLLQCPDTLMLAVYGPHDGSVEEILRNRMIAALRGSRASRPAQVVFPPSFEDHTPFEVATWSNKRPPTPVTHTTLVEDQEHPVQISVVVGGSINTMWARTLDDAVAICGNIRESGCTVQMTLETMVHVIIIVVPRLSGGTPSLYYDEDNLPHVRIKLVTPYETRFLDFPHPAAAADYIRTLVRSCIVRVSIDEDGFMTYTLTGRLPGGGQNRRDKKPKHATTQKGAEEQADQRSETRPTTQMSADFERAMSTKKSRDNKRREAGRQARQAVATSSSSSSSSSSLDAAPYSRSSDWADAMDDEDDDDLNDGSDAQTPTEVLREAVSSLSTSAAAAKASLTTVIKNGMIAMKAFRRSEPDWDDEHSRWLTTFQHLGERFYFDSRILEEDRIDLMNTTDSLPHDVALALFKRHFHTVPDQLLTDQIAFGWGARNFRELCKENVQIISRVKHPRIPPVRNFAYAYVALTPITTADQLASAARILLGQAWAADLNVVRAWAETHLDLDVSDRLRNETMARQRITQAAGQLELDNPLIPAAPVLPPDEPIESIKLADRYTTSIDIDHMPLPRNKTYREDFGVRAHVALMQYINAYSDHLAEGHEKITSIVEVLVPERHAFLRSVLKMVGVASILALPAFTAFRTSTTARATFAHVIPLMGLRLYNRRHLSKFTRDVKAGLESYDPMRTRVTLSEDMPWSASMLNREPADSYFTSHRDAQTMHRYATAPANPLTRLAAMLTSQSRAQVPEPVDPDSSYVVDSRTMINSHDKMLVSECCVAAMRVTSTCHEGTAHKDILVCRELLSRMTQNTMRYKSIMTGPNGFFNLHAALLTGTLQAATNFNIPVTTRDRADIEHDTAFAAALVIWARCCQNDGASVDPLEDY